MLALIFGGDEEIKAEEQKLREKYKEPKKIQLSEKSQKIFVEWFLYVVFEDTKYWYDYFEENVDIEKIYYICLEYLINSVKYCFHNENQSGYHFTDDFIFDNLERLKFNFDYDRENVEKPSKIYSYLRKEKYDVDYIKNVSSNEFMQEYNDILNSFDS